VARALGITLSGDPRKMIAEGAGAPGKRNVSMLQDICAERQTEVDFMNGAIADLGEKLGVAMPLNRALWSLVKGLEHSSCGAVVKLRERTNGIDGGIEN